MANNTDLHPCWGGSCSVSRDVTVVRTFDVNFDGQEDQLAETHLECSDRGGECSPYNDPHSIVLQLQTVHGRLLKLENRNDSRAPVAHFLSDNLDMIVAERLGSNFFSVGDVVETPDGSSGRISDFVFDINQSSGEIQTMVYVMGVAGLYNIEDLALISPVWGLDRTARRIAHEIQSRHPVEFRRRRELLPMGDGRLFHNRDLSAIDDRLCEEVRTRIERLPMGDPERLIIWQMIEDLLGLIVVYSPWYSPPWVRLDGYRPLSPGYLPDYPKMERLPLELPDI